MILRWYQSLHSSYIYKYWRPNCFIVKACLWHHKVTINKAAQIVSLLYHNSFTQATLYLPRNLYNRTNHKYFRSSQNISLINVYILSILWHKNVILSYLAITWLSVKLTKWQHVIQSVLSICYSWLYVIYIIDHCWLCLPSYW